MSGGTLRLRNVSTCFETIAGPDIEVMCCETNQEKNSTWAKVLIAQRQLLFGIR